MYFAKLDSKTKKKVLSIFDTYPDIRETDWYEYEHDQMIDVTSSCDVSEQQYAMESFLKKDLAEYDEYGFPETAARVVSAYDLMLSVQKSYLKEYLAEHQADVEAEDHTRVYMFTWAAEDEDGKTEKSLEDITEFDEDKSASQWTEELCSFLGQTNETYIDKWGVVHEIYQGKDQPFAYYFEVYEGNWQEVVGNIGERLDDSLNKDMPEDIRQGFADIYNHAMKQVKLQELSVKANSLNNLAEIKGMQGYSINEQRFADLNALAAEKGLATEDEELDQFIDSVFGE